MGGETSREPERSTLDGFVNALREGPNLRVDSSIVIFCSRESSNGLRTLFQSRKRRLTGKEAGWIKSLAEKLGRFAASPELAGLGALAVAILIDTMSASSPGESTKEALRCVFAEEKASEVWDLIDECLKRCVMNLTHRSQLLSDLERIEWQLSAALTRLRNSMVRDGHMSSAALKAWVNGAAFHVQMLIHLVRLGGIQTCDPVERLLCDYKRDLEPLFKKHRETIKKQCHVRSECIVEDNFFNRFMVDEESNEYDMHNDFNYDEHFEAYYDHKYGRQKRDIQEYFIDVRRNLQGLVCHSGDFSVH